MSAVPGADLDLGAIGNCQVAGLIDRLGRLVWGCLPRLDGDPAFSALLTREARGEVRTADRSESPAPRIRKLQEA